jgi:DNA (cytosine-5)-methyltransferase 1
MDAIHASPPCQAYTMLRRVNLDRQYPDLVGSTRDLLISTGLPYVIENVVGSPLREPAMLCGSSFGLRLRRHRLFETNWSLMTPVCAHDWQMDKKFPALNGADRKAGRRSGIVGVYGNGGDKRADLWAGEMEIDWMTRRELTQAIPPAYTELIGAQLLAQLPIPDLVPVEPKNGALTSDE